MMRAVLFCVAFASLAAPRELSEKNIEKLDPESQKEIEDLKALDAKMKKGFEGGPKLEDYVVKQPHLQAKALNFEKLREKGEEIEKQKKLASDDVDYASEANEDADAMRTEFEQSHANSFAEVGSKYIDTPLPVETDDYKLREAEDKMKITESKVNGELKRISERLAPPTDAAASSLLQTQPRSPQSAALAEKVKEAKNKFRSDFDKEFHIESGEADGLESMDDEDEPIEAATDDETDSSFLQTAQKSKYADFPPMPKTQAEDDAMNADDNKFLDTPDDMSALTKLDNEADQKKDLIKKMTEQVTGQAPESDHDLREAEQLDKEPMSLLETKSKLDVVHPDDGGRLPTFTNGRSRGNWEQVRADDEEALENTEIDEQDSLQTMKEDQIKNGDIIVPDDGDDEDEDVVKEYHGKIGGTAGYLGPKDGSSLLQTAEEDDVQTDEDLKTKRFEARLKHQIEELKDNSIPVEKVMQEDLKFEAPPSSFIQVDDNVPTHGNQLMKEFEAKLKHQIEELKDKSIPVEKVIQEDLKVQDAHPSSLLQKGDWSKDINAVNLEPKKLKSKLTAKVHDLEESWKIDFAKEKREGAEKLEKMQSKFTSEENKQKAEWSDVKQNIADAIDKKVDAMPSSFMQEGEHHVSEEEISHERDAASKAANDLFRIQKTMKSEEARMETAAKAFKVKEAHRKEEADKRHMAYEAKREARENNHIHHLESLRKEE